MPCSPRRRSPTALEARRRRRWPSRWSRIERLRLPLPGAAAELRCATIELEVEPGELDRARRALRLGQDDAAARLLRPGPALPRRRASRRALEVAGLDVREHGPAELGGAGRPGRPGPRDPGRLDDRARRARAAARAARRAAAPRGRGRSRRWPWRSRSTHLLDRAADTLSGGELQRVALAAALVLRPRLVLLDEPTSQLDPVAGDELIGLLRRLNEEWGMTVLLAEHRLERCLAAADRVVALVGGADRVRRRARADSCAWALEADPELATPGGAPVRRSPGSAPPPVAVKEARRGPASRRYRSRERRPASSPAQRAPRGAGAPRSPACARACADLWVELDDGAGPREVLRGHRPRDRAGRAGRADGPKRRGQEHPAACRGRDGSSPHRGAPRAPGGCALLPQSPTTCWFASGSARSSPARPARRALARSGSSGPRTRDPRDLSGGERQRLALAIVMAGRAAGPAARADLPRRADPRAWTAPARTTSRAWLGELADGGRRGRWSPPTTSSSRPASPSGSSCWATGELIADGPAAEVLSGGWYFATEVARILGVGGRDHPRAGRRAAAPSAWPRAAEASRSRELAGRSLRAARPGRWSAGSPGTSARARPPGWSPWSPRSPRSAVAGRLVLAPIPNVVATTDIVLITGYALGAGPGFAVGALAAPISNIWLGQGPWTPWEMAGWGLVGLGGAALAVLTRRRLGRLGARARLRARRLRLRRAARPLGDGHLRRRAVARPLPGALGARAPVQRRPRRRQLRASRSPPDRRWCG